MSRYVPDRRGNWIPQQQAIEGEWRQPPPAPMVDADALLRVLTEAETGRGEVLGQIVFSAAWGVFATLGDVALVHAADTGPELALLGLGTALVAWSTIRARGLLLDVVEIVNRWSAKVERSRILLEHRRQIEATKRTRERRFMAELNVRQMEAAERAVQAHKTRVEQGNREADRLHLNRQRLLEMLESVYEEPGRRYAGGQPFSQRAIGRPWYSELQRIGAIELAGRHPQWCWDVVDADTADEALDWILHKSPGFLSLAYEGS